MARSRLVRHVIVHNKGADLEIQPGRKEGETCSASEATARMTDIENYVGETQYTPHAHGQPASGGGVFAMNPGIGIVTYWKGMVEIGLRAVTLVSLNSISALTLDLHSPRARRQCIVQGVYVLLVSRMARHEVWPYARLMYFQ